MTLTTYLAYVTATILILMTPGPTVLLVISQSLAGGRARGMRMVAGVALGDMTSMTFSFAGLGALLAVSATLFFVLKLCGAAYLIWMGIRLWREGVHVGDKDMEPGRERIGPSAAEPSGRTLFVRAYLVTATNPKAIAFFVAFVPQFVNHQVAVLPQLALCGATFVVLAAFNVAGYAWLAGSLRERFKSPRVLKLLGRTGACALMAAGVMTAALRRAS